MRFSEWLEKVKSEGTILNYNFFSGYFYNRANGHYPEEYLFIENLEAKEILTFPEYDNILTSKLVEEINDICHREALADFYQNYFTPSE